MKRSWRQRLLCDWLDRHDYAVQAGITARGRAAQCRDCGTELPGTFVAAPVYRGACPVVSMGGMSCQLQFGHQGSHHHPAYGTWWVADRVEDRGSDEGI